MLPLVGSNDALHGLHYLLVTERRPATTPIPAQEQFDNDLLIDTVP
jgi:hypothetical protein